MKEVSVDGGTVTTLTSMPDGPVSGGLTADSSSVYWTTPAGGGSVMKIASLGGNPITLASGQGFPTGIAVDETSVYWADYGAIDHASGSIRRLTPR
jgi:hypothetical protein